MRQWNLWMLGLMACVVALAAGCSGPAEESTTVKLSDPAELGTLAAQVDAEPERADEILTAVNVTREEFEEAILEVARDPEKAQVYAEAFRAAGTTKAAAS